MKMKKTLSDKLPDRQLKRLFPHASKDFQRLNSDSSLDSRMSSKSKQVDWKEICETSGGEEMRKVNRFIHVEIKFFAGHGQTFDEDNRRYIAKPYLDALTNLRFSTTDKNFTSEVTQWHDKNNLNI